VSDMNDWLKIPGLFHRCEFEQVIEVDLTDKEKAALLKSAAAVQELVDVMAKQG